MTKKLIQQDIVSQAEALRKREISSEELVKTYLIELWEKNNEIGAFLSVSEESALAEARASDRRRAEGKSLGILDGIPFAAKDNLCAKNLPTTCGSRMLEGYFPPYDATAIEKLTAAGSILLGKTNLDEFGMGSSTECSAFHPTRNPYDLARTAGGSSGGSAAAVAASMAAYALGSDTGGSVRQPAAFCGLFGMKPTYGRVSRYGLVAFGSSLEQVGVLSRSLSDNAVVLSAISGYDPRDATTVRRDVPDFLSQIEKGIAGLRIGVLPEDALGELSGAVSDALARTVAECERLGARIVPASLPSLSLAAEAYYLISSAEASAELARFDGVRYGRRAEGASDIEELYKKSRSEGLGREVKRRLLLGTFALSEGYYDAYYGRARTLAARLGEEMRELLRACDLLLLPTTPSVAHPLGDKHRIDDPTVSYREDRLTVLANLTGLPALSFPVGRDENGLPIGLQLMADAFCEELLYRGAHVLANTNQKEAEE